MRLRDTPLFGLLNAAVCVIACTAAIGAGASWALTFTSRDGFMPSWYFAPFFVLMFPLSGWAAFLANAGRRGRRAVDWGKVLPSGLWIPLGLIIGTVTILSATVNPSTLPGQPEYDPVRHQYGFNNHGVVIPASRAAYLHAVDLQNRLFLAAAVIFTSVAAAITYGECKRRRREAFTPPRWRHPTRPRPGIPLPVSVLAILATTALTGLAVGGVLIIERVNAYGGSDAIYLHAGHPVAARLPADDYVVFTGCSDSMRCASLAPSQITVQTAAGSAVTVVADPSEDHMSVAGQPDLGRLSFVLSSARVVRIELATTPAQPVIVLPSPGEEAHALAGWIVLTVASLLSLIATAIPLCYVLAWRLGFGTARMQAYPIPDATPESPAWLPLATRELAASGLRRPRRTLGNAHGPRPGSAGDGQLELAWADGFG